MRVKKMVIGGFLIALNLVLPYVTHLIPGGGKLFLPMHIGVLTAGLLLGIGYGVAIGLIAPLLGFLVMGMPQMPTTVFMMFELAAYGGFAGGFCRIFRKFGMKQLPNTCLSLVLSMIIGRLVYAGVLLAAGFITAGTAPAVATVFASFLAGLPGVAVQLVLIPILVLTVRRAAKLDKPKEKAIRY